MNKEETEKFNQVISDSYKEILTKRPEKPLQHFIFHMLMTLPETLRSKDAVVKDFYKNYSENDLKNVKELKF